MDCKVSKAVAAGLVNAVGWVDEESRASSLPQQGNGELGLAFGRELAPD